MDKRKFLSVFTLGIIAAAGSQAGPERVQPRTTQGIDRDKWQKGKVDFSKPGSTQAKLDVVARVLGLID